ncbi:MAG: hypothetical protein A2X84_14295 [Desulfuromonadaceae bacterium GWC2_58_13]|nr:MAG: hypothetical protein A2X84_14295 [Desulfuromonadaceae bacterium GWC2_58_13]
MKKNAGKELQRIKGIGQVLSQRMVGLGIDSIARVIEAGAEGLGAVPGLHARLIPSILVQAEDLAGEEACGSGEVSGMAEIAAAGEKKIKKAKSQKQLAGLQLAAEKLRERVQGLLSDMLVKKEGLSEKGAGKRLQKEAGKLLQTLARVEAKMGGRPKNTGKKLAKTGKRLDALEGMGPNKLSRGLKKARKPLKRIAG